MKIVLASQSPRRKELLGRMGLEFVTQASKIDESAFDGLEARELVATLSREKAQWIARQLDGETLVIGADTVVVLWASPRTRRTPWRCSCRCPGGTTRSAPA